MALESAGEQNDPTRRGVQLITRTELNERIREWGIREDVIEKDYVIGWVLWGIGADPELSASWAFKGGTCLKKCYVETFRFSEDLDFTLLPGTKFKTGQVTRHLKRALVRVYEESGISLLEREPVVRMRPDGRSVEGRVYYRGPRNAPSLASIRIDLTIAEKIVRPTVLRPIAHAYPDAFPLSAHVRCYSFEEVFAEKLRAMGERARPRDLYDIITLYRRPFLGPDATLVRTVFREKCESKGLEVFSSRSILASPFLPELKEEWANMLEHQLSVLPPFSALWDELPQLLAWLEGRGSREELPSIPTIDDIDDAWSPPATLSFWGLRTPLEKARFAAVNRLCVEVGYQDRTFMVEPYSLRKTRSDQLILYTVVSITGSVCAYRVDQIDSLNVTATAFTPRFALDVFDASMVTFSVAGCS